MRLAILTITLLVACTGAASAAIARGQLATLTDPANRVTRYEYDELNLVRVINPDGTDRHYHYEDSRFPANITGVTDERGVRSVTVRYDYRGRAVETSGPDGADHYRFSYGAGVFTEIDPLGTEREYRMTRVEDIWRITTSAQPCGACGGSDAASATFDSRGYVASETDFKGNQTRYSFNDRGLLVSQTDAHGTLLARTTTTEWHPDWRVPTLITEPAASSGEQITRQFLDARGNVELRTVSADGETRTWDFTWNAFGQPLTEDGPRSDVADTLVHTYDAQGNRETTTDALGFVTTYDSYDAHGKLLQMTDPNGLVTEYRYDDRDRLTRVLIGTPGNWEVTVYDYDDAGNLTRLTLPDGSFLDYGYDNAGRMDRITDALGNRIDYGYNGIGERTSEQTFDAEGQLAMTMSRAFDALGRLDTITGADPADITDFDHDANGNETRQQSPLHANPSISDYDELDRLSLTTDPTGAEIEYEYDAQDNLRRVIDPRALPTIYGYNGFNELTALTSPDTGNTGYDYDAAGNLDFQTDARGVRADYDYDAADRLTLITYPDEQLDFVYDEATGGEGRRGRLTTASTEPRNGSAADATETGYSYDRHGRILSKTQQVGNADALVTEHDYDDSGRIETTTLPSGVQIGYGYGSDGRVLSIRVNGVEIVREVEYFPLGEAKSWRYGSSGRYEREFDADGRIDEHTLGNVTRDIDFDLAGRISDIVDSAPAQSSWSYEYDDADRLTLATNAATSGPTAQHRYDWDFDDTGNRTEQLLAIGAAPADLTIYGIEDGSNRLESLSGAISDTRGFDEVGNTTRWRSQGGTHNGSELTASYSGRNRQTAVNRIDSGGEARIARYAYNAFGERIAKWTGAAASQPTAAPTRQYVYDEAGHLVGEYDATGSLVAEHIWLEDTPVAVLKPTGSTRSLSTYLSQIRVYSSPQRCRDFTCSTR